MKAPAPFILTLTICATLASAAQADRRVYAGREAAALKCAAYYSYTSHIGESRGVMTRKDAEAGRAIGHYILSTAISGTWDQKMKAYKVILGRMPSNDLRLFRDASRHLSWCGKTFVN